MNSLISSFVDTCKKKMEPAFPVTLGSHPLQQIIVRFSMLLKIEAQIVEYMFP